MNNKIVVVIYVNPSSESTKILTDFISKRLDKINEHLLVKLIKVTKNNVNLVKSKGIERTPTLVYEGKKYVSLEKIIKILTPPADQKDNFGYGVTSSDELVHTYHDAILNEDPEDDDNEDDPENRGNAIRQKMAAFQKRRPQMSGVDETKRIKGGRKLKNNPTAGKRKFENDEDFVKASRMDNVESTPMKNYMDDSDGNLMLEEYYLEEAKRSGKSVGQRVSKRR